MLEKLMLAYKNWGITGVAQKIWLILKDQAALFFFKLRKFLFENSQLYYNYVNFSNDIKATHWAASRIVEKGLRPLEQLPIRDFKKSDKLFILGSGSSINDLDSAAWEHISLHDSVGFNFWMLHDFVPSFYFIEPPVGQDDAWHELLTVFNLKKGHYTKTPFVCDYKDWQFHEEKFPLKSLPAEIVRNMYFYAPYRLRLNDKTLIAFVLWYWRFFRVNQPKFCDLINQRATLSTLIMFGLLAGYKEIVLLGIDLNNTAYFWEAHSQKQYPVAPVNAQKGKIHRSADPKIDINRLSIPVDEYVYLLDQIILKPLGIRLSIGSEKSRLYPRLTKYQFLD